MARLLSGVSGVFNSSNTTVTLSFTFSGTFEAQNSHFCNDISPAHIGVIIFRTDLSNNATTIYSINSGGQVGPTSWVDNNSVQTGRTYKYQVYSTEYYWEYEFELSGCYLTEWTSSPYYTENVSTTANDTTPDAFTFTDIYDASLNTNYTSNQITVSGINAAAAISVTGGTYSINGGSYTSSSGTVNNGSTVAVRVVSSSSHYAYSNATLTIGGVSDTYSVRTIADTTPVAFTFADVTSAARSTLYTSNTVTITGIVGPAPISISGGGGSYSVNGGAFTTSSGSITNGSTVAVRLTSSDSYSTVTSTTLTVGSVSDTYSVTTEAAPGSDTTPNAFTFTDVANATLNTQYTSNQITVSGINAAAPISISGGTYSINGGSYTAASGTVTNGSTVRVRLTSSGSYSTMTSTTLTIGGVSDTYRVTTQAGTTPSNVNRVVLGSLGGKSGLFVSKPGYDVLTANAAQMNFHIDGRLTQVIAQGSVTFAANATGTVNIPLSNLNGNVPIVTAYETLKVGSGTAVLGWSSFFTYTCNSTTLSVTVSTAIPYALTATYVVFSDTING